jgi:nucleotide-binding universal stress UspA family protein
MYPEIKTILYATDMGDHMYPVFRFALGVAKNHAARITMLHVAEPLSSGMRFAINAYMPEITAKEVLRDGMAKALAKMQQRLDKFCEDELEKSPEDRELVTGVKVVSGRPAETITQQAQQLEADLIVVGTHTDPSFGAQLIGSTARKVTQLSKIPVLVIPVCE